MRENEKEAHNKVPHRQGSVIRVRIRSFDLSFLKKLYRINEFYYSSAAKNLLRHEIVSS